MQRKIGVIFLGGLLSRALFFHLTDGYTVDRAFIIFRYAENIAAGHGFVFNLGDRVLGVWGPLYPFLLATLNLLQISTPNAALLVALTCSSLTAVVLFRLGLLLRFTRLAVLPAILYMLWPPSLIADINGTELALFTLLVTAAFYYHHKRLYVYATGLATLATLTRPEGLILLLLMIVSGCCHDRACRQALVYTPILLLVPWLGFAWFYFATVIPQPVVVWHELSLPTTGSLWYGTTAVAGLRHVYGWILIPAVLLGLIWLNRTQNFGRLEIIWLVASVIWYGATLGRFDPAHGAALFPLCLLFLGAAVVWLRGIVAIHRVAVTIAVMGTLSMTWLLGVFNYLALGYISQEQYDEDTTVRLAGVYLNRHGDVDNDKAAVYDVGYLGYYSKMQMIDLEGIVSPEVVPYLRTDAITHAILDMKPEWVGLTGDMTGRFTGDTLFTSRYQSEESFEGERPWGYVLYRQLPKDRTTP